MLRNSQAASHKLPLRGYLAAIAVFCNEVKESALALSRDLGLSYNRRVSNGDQVSRVAALAMKRGKSVDFTGYLQRHIAE
jgi:hypothetical protein